MLCYRGWLNQALTCTTCSILFIFTTALIWTYFSCLFIRDFLNSIVISIISTHVNKKITTNSVYTNIFWVYLYAWQFWLKFQNIQASVIWSLKAKIHHKLLIELSILNNTLTVKLTSIKYLIAMMKNLYPIGDKYYKWFIYWLIYFPSVFNLIFTWVW